MLCKEGSRRGQKEGKKKKEEKEEKEKKKKKKRGVPILAQQVKNPTSIHEDVGLIPGLTQWVKDLAWL